MATWQADFYFTIDEADLPADYRDRFSAVLPVGRSWSSAIEMWGEDESDRIDVMRSTGTQPEIFCRFDMREWKPNLYRRFLDCVRGIGGRLSTARDESVP